MPRGLPTDGANHHGLLGFGRVAVLVVSPTGAGEGECLAWVYFCCRVVCISESQGVGLHLLLGLQSPRQWDTNDIALILFGAAAF